MPIKMLEHVNLRTTQMDLMIRWYEKILGLRSGERPPFEEVGAWLYHGGIPMVHLLEVERQETPDDPRLEHFAFRAENLKGFLETLEQESVEYRTIRVPKLEILQVYISDPDGNHMHIDFPKAEADSLGL